MWGSPRSYSRHRAARLGNVERVGMGLGADRARRGKVEAAAGTRTGC